MTEGAASPEESNVCVAVKIRPLVSSELDEGCRESLFVTPGLPQVSTGQHTFTYDHVFGEGGSSPDLLYSRCIAPLVAGLFKGYNATVFAYGQTGSGKTFTMGSEYKPGGRCRGVIPDAINDIFSRIEAAKDTDITVRVSFVEIHKEEVKDLLLPAGGGPRPTVTIRETQAGDVALYGAVEKEVRSRNEMAEVLEIGALCRSTASTQMNNRSSRSHAIFTITVEQRRQMQAANGAHTHGEGADEEGEDDDDAGGEDGDGLDDFLGAKMHLVDLAGSERAKRTKAEGARLREGIHINRGLLALGNVINAIVDNHKHVPYRDSKLTRLLQDSLGGNSRTVMIACVSPADSNHEESLNTLRYADRARHIRNKPVVNRDPVAAQLASLRNTIAQLKSENLSLKRALNATGVEVGTPERFGGFDTSGLEPLVDRLTQENSSLEAENMRLRMEMDDLRRELADVADKWHTAQAQYDILRMNQAAAAARRESSQGGAVALSAEDSGSGSTLGMDIVKGYVARIAQLEAELKHFQALAATHVDFPKRRAPGREPQTPGIDPGAASPDRSQLPGDTSGADDGDDEVAPDQPSGLVEEEEYYTELVARTLDQEKMRKEVALLQRQLEAKELKMKKLMMDTGNMPALKQHYDRVLAELESQRDTLVAERKAMQEKLSALSAANEEERKRLEASYKERLQQCDERLRELRRKERDYIAMAKLKQRTEEAHNRLSADITRIKQQKVAMQRQLDAHAKQFAQWRQEREKEIAQLRKQGRKDRAKIEQLQAMNAKQNAVLQRKITDANVARKRLKELNTRRVANQTSSASAQHQQAAATVAAQQALGGNVEMQPNLQAPVLRSDKDRREWLHKELELCNMSWEFRKVIEGELAQRGEAHRKLKDLEKRLVVLEQLHPASPLLAGNGASMIPVSPSLTAQANAMGAMSPESRAALLAKKKELEDEVAHHNAQIEQLQADWERQKAEEEQRGGGAMDFKRWAGLRSVVECRELLRTLFRMLVESKALNNEYTNDMTRFGEELNVLKVQLEGAQKKCAQYRKLATVYQAAATRVSLAPAYAGVTPLDETDQAVDAVLEELHVVRSKTPQPAKATPHEHGDMEPAAMDESVPMSIGPALVPDGDVEMVDVEADPEPEDDVECARKALAFLSPVPSEARARMRPSEANASQRYSPEHNDDRSDDEVEVVNDGTRRRESRAYSEGGTLTITDDSEYESDKDDGELVEDEEEEDEEDDEVSTASDSDREWVPEAATPAPAFGRNRRGSRRISRVSSASLEEEDTLGVSARKGRKSRVGSRRNSVSQGSGSSSPQDVELERHVLNAINVDRALNGMPRVPKLTVPILKEALKGQTIDGQRWSAGNKKRAALIHDYSRLLGTNGGAGPSHAPPEQQGARQVAENGREESGSGGARPAPLVAVESLAAGPSEPEGFTFSPHFTKAAPDNSNGTSAAPPASAAHPPSPPAATPTGSNRRLNVGSQLGPWARSSLNGQSARQPTTWASSLRVSCTLPGAEADGAAAGERHLSRSNSAASNGSLSRSMGSSMDGGGATTRRPLSWTSPANGNGSGSAGALRECAAYRAPLASPRQSVSPRLPGQTATGATSPQSSLGSPTLGIPPRSSSKSPRIGGSQSPEVMLGGENMQPMCSTPTGATANAAASGAGKGTPSSVFRWTEKYMAAKERNSVLRSQMQRNWEQHDAQHNPRAGGGAGGVRSSLGSLTSGALGNSLSSLEGQVKPGQGSLRDSYGVGLLGNKQKAIWR